MNSDEIKKISELARLEVGSAEATALALEIEAILGYVSQVKDVVGTRLDEEGVVLGQVVNVFREDISPTEPGTFSQELINEFPQKQGDYLKVKKIL
jgi:aspartyl-tRNA(Asn)/glutamyl-tRNA(Gln) amidotransferase subunit C